MLLVVRLHRLRVVGVLFGAVLPVLPSLRFSWRRLWRIARPSTLSRPSVALFVIRLGSLKGTGNGISPELLSLGPQMSASMSCTLAWWVGVAPMLQGSDSLRTMGDNARGGIGFVSRSGKTSRTDDSSCLVRGAAKRFSSVMWGRIYFLAQSSCASDSVMSPSSISTPKIRFGDPR